MDSRVLTHNPLTGITTTFHYDDVTDGITLEQAWASDVDELNVAQRNEHSDYGPTRWKGDWHHAARVPLVVLEQLRVQGILDDPKAFGTWLNDRDNQVFRTMPGRV